MTKDDEIDQLRAQLSRARALLSWISGACTDEIPHLEIDEAIYRYWHEEEAS